MRTKNTGANAGDFIIDILRCNDISTILYTVNKCNKLLFPIPVKRSFKQNIFHKEKLFLRILRIK